jgi:protocatechuate 3,4-dioxygenase beta subunit
MRWCLFLLLPALLPAQSTPQSNTTARLEGQVLSQAGEPLRKAKVWLRPNGSHQNAEAYSDTSDANGNFVFEAVTPGRYNLSAERTGFLSQNYGARSADNLGPGAVLTLAPGQTLKGLTFKLSPQGVITGRVVDSDGDPVQGLQVRVMRMFRTHGERRLLFTGAAATDDQGDYRIVNLTPGMYYVVADNANSRMYGQYETARPGRVPSRQADVATYYPSGLDAASATAVEITPGSDVRGIEIQMRREAVYSIRGVVIDATSGKPVAANLNARSKENLEFGLGVGGTNSREDGTFELRNLLPGAYLLEAGSNNGVQGSAKEEITVTDSDVTGLKLALTQGAAMAGTIRIESAGPQTPINNLPRCNIMLLGADGSIRAPSARPKEDGTFELRGVVPGKYVVNIYNMPDGMYVKSVRAGGQDATRTLLDLTSGVSGTLDILLSPRAAEVMGTVRNSDGEPVPGVQITLWPKEGQPNNLRGGISISATDQNGDFRVAGLAPGDYFVTAWEELEQGLGDDVDFLRRFTSQAVALTLEEGAHQTAQPKLISREAEAVEAAKLP